MRAALSRSSGVGFLVVNILASFWPLSQSKQCDAKPVPILLKGICRFPKTGYMKSAMPITPYLVGQPFEPELIREMSLALESVCGTLKLRLTDNPNTRLVASKIIELAQRGVRDGTTLSAMTLKEFKHS